MNRETELAAPSIKRAYQEPTLRVWGNVETLTQCGFTTEGLDSQYNAQLGYYGSVYNDGHC